MNPVASIFEQLRLTGKKAFIPYIMGGDPGIEKTVQLIEILAAGGADLIEIGVPFSDPVADGPVIQQAAVRALQHGCTLEKLLTALTKVNRQLDIPLILMIYYNMIFHRGVQNFFAALSEAGCAGIIIPDLPPEEAADVQQYAMQYQIGLNFLVAPTSSDERISLAAEASSGFLYAVSLKGVTGARTNLPPELPDFIRKIKRITDKPVAVGFGISTPEQARMIGQLADGIIVGSAIVKAVADDPSLGEVKRLLAVLRAAIS